MWKVGDVEPVRVMGAEGYPYGFRVTTDDGKPLVSFAYASRALAEAAATHLESALLNAISVHPRRIDRSPAIPRLWLLHLLELGFGPGERFRMLGQGGLL